MMADQSKAQLHKPRRLDLKVLGKIVLVLISIPLFFFSIPAWLIYWLLGLLKKTKLVFLQQLTIPRYRILISIIVGVALGIIWVLSFGPNASITILEPQNGFITDQSSVVIKGTISPYDASIGINDRMINLSVDEDGYFSHELILANIPENALVENEFVITADDDSIIIKILRQFSDQEVSDYKDEMQAIQDQKNAEIQKEKDILEAELNAIREAWNNSKAGRLCNANPDWAKEECEAVADNNYWIGMTLEMLKAMRGTPNSANPSNYGNGIQWQWCWHKYTPSCFYGGDDGIIDSYN